MNASESVNYLKYVQRAFQVIAMLQIGAFMWPPQATIQDGATFDFIVVGAGTAGCVVAARLAEDNHTRVLLLEAGGDPPLEANIPGMMIYLEKSYVDWNLTSTDDGYSSQCQASHVHDLTMGKMLGGTGSLDFLLNSHGYYGDYDGWANITNDNTWSWKAVKPYFRKALTIQSKFDNSLQNSYLYNTTGKINLLKSPRDKHDVVYLNAFKEAGNRIVPFFDVHNSLGYTKTLHNIGDGVRQSTAYTYLRPIKDYPNLFVLKNSVAKKLLLDDAKKAVGVEIVTDNGKTITVKAIKEVILSAGAINSPKLLMLSGIGPKGHLKSKGIEVISDLPVGQNLQDHVAVTIVHNMTKLDEPMQTRDSREYPAHVYTGCTNLDETKEYPETCFINFRNYANFLIQFCAHTYGLNDEICNALFANANTNEMLYTMASIVKPESRGSIHLRSKNYEDAPIVQTGFYTDKRDLENMVRYLKEFLRVTNTSSFRSVGAEFVNPKLSKCAEFEFGSKDYWRCYALCMMTSRRYYAGTNAMGSVVDSRLKVMGVKNLRVVDASVMPLVTVTETFSPTVMIAEKAADMIKVDNDIEIVK